MEVWALSFGSVTKLAAAEVDALWDGPELERGRDAEEKSGSEELGASCTVSARPRSGRAAGALFGLALAPFFRRQRCA
jgi:hypothetical protein